MVLAQLPQDVTTRLARLRRDLSAEFPQVPLDAIEHDVDEHARSLIEVARFNDFVPVLVHRAVREDLRAAG